MRGCSSNVVLDRICDAIPADCCVVYKRCKGTSKWPQGHAELARKAQRPGCAGQIHIQTVTPVASYRLQTCPLVSSPVVLLIKHARSQGIQAPREKEAGERKNKGAALKPGLSNAMPASSSSEPVTAADSPEPDYRVLEKDGVVYSATLIQTSIGTEELEDKNGNKSENKEVNTNKFYFMQLLERHDVPGYYLFTSWARVGRASECSQLLGAKMSDRFSDFPEAVMASMPPMESVDDAIMEFKLRPQKKFRNKVGSDWGMPADRFQRKEGLYQPVDIEPGFDAMNLWDRASTAQRIAREKDLSELPLGPQGPVYLKMPLGPVSRQAIAKARATLRKIFEALTREEGQGTSQGPTDHPLPSIVDLSNEYYMTIPHKLDKAKYRCGPAPSGVIRTVSQVEAEEQLLEYMSKFNEA